MLRGWSIKKKLTFISMTTSCAALALSSAGFLTYDMLQYRGSMREALVTEAKIIGENSAAALAFGDVKGAERVLGALKARPSVVAAVIYGANRQVFAAYTNQPADRARDPQPSTGSETFIRAEFPITLDGVIIGTVAIESDNRDFRQRLVSYLAIVGALMLVSASVAFFLSARLRKLITKPIVDLRSAMNEVSVRRDYSLRVPRRSGDELGDMVDGFNLMIGEIQKAQADLSSLNAGLERRVAERSRAAEERAAALEESEKYLRIEKERAEQASRTKSVFLANMSHELRTPLNVIIGYSEMLEEELEDTESSTHLQDLGRIHAAGKHLLSVINDILDLSKIEAGKIQVDAQSFDLGSIVQEVTRTVSSLIAANSNSLSVIVPGKLPVSTDQTKVRQILINLLGNACKFTKSGSITVRAGESLETGCVFVSVEDTGIGIKNDIVEGLFEPFAQADASTTRKYGGTGLGLPISRRFCRMLGGELTVLSKLGAGSTFTMTIKANYADPQVSEALPGSVSDPVSTSAEDEELAIIVDDDLNACELLSRMLSKQGFRTMTCSSGKDGIDAIHHYRPAIVTLDVQMAGMDGWTTLSVLKNDPVVCSIPVILVTIVDEKVRGLSLGASEYITKPLKMEALQAAVQRCRRTVTRPPSVETDPELSRV